MVKSFDFGEFPPENISWAGITNDGALAAKGDYMLVVAAEDMAGNKGVNAPSAVFTFDTTEASLILAASDAAFSPNGDKVQDVMTFTPVSGQGADVTKYVFKVLNEKSEAVYQKSENKKLPVSITWNGKADDGILCPDGIYSAVLDIETANGSSSSASTGAFGLDTVAPSLMAETQWADFSPDGDGNQDTIPVKVLDCSAEKAWVCEVRNSKKKLLRSIHGMDRFVISTGMVQMSLVTLQQMELIQCYLQPVMMLETLSVQKSVNLFWITAKQKYT